MMLRDMHLHSDFSDGENSVYEMAAAAHDCGCKEICFTDHVRHNSDWWPKYYAACQSVEEQYRESMRIFCGVEAKVCDFHGTLDIPSDLSPKILQIAAIHRLPDGNGGFLRKDELRGMGSSAVDCWFNAVIGLRENHRINRFAHPFSLLPYMDVPLNELFWKRVTEAMEGTSYLIEYNLKYDNSIVPKSFWDHFSSRLIVGTDSHSVQTLEKIWGHPDNRKIFQKETDGT